MQQKIDDIINFKMNNLSKNGSSAIMRQTSWLQVLWCNSTIHRLLGTNRNV